MVSSVLSLVYFLGSQFFGSHPYRTPPVLGIGITHSTPSDDPANTLHLESRSEAVVIIRSYTNADPLCYLKDALSDTGAGFCRTLTRALTPRNPRERSFLRSLLAQVFEYVGDEYPGGTCSQHQQLLDTRARDTGPPRPRPPRRFCGCKRPPEVLPLRRPR